jgi:hypothetical protein
MALEATTDKVLELYQADPAVGSPYRTGDELFGLPASYKRQKRMRVIMVTLPRSEIEPSPYTHTHTLGLYWYWSLRKPAVSMKH